MANNKTGDRDVVESEGVNSEDVNNENVDSENESKVVSEPDPASKAASLFDAGGNGDLLARQERDGPPGPGQELEVGEG